jgi:predicted nucleic acid-binding protein
LGLVEDLDAGPVAIDTATVIYFLEEDVRYLPLIRPLFEQVSDGRRELVTSALTLLEVLVIPYRAGNRALADRYEDLLTRSRGFRLVDLTRDQLRAAAQLRAATGVKVPDALQIAAALVSGCTALITNDRRLPSVRGLRVIQLASYL